MTAFEIGNAEGMTDAERVRRTLSDHGRLLWRDDRDGHCTTPDLCGDYETVRCGPCAISQANAAGVVTLIPDWSYSPEVCRLQRELKALQMPTGAGEQ